MPHRISKPLAGCEYPIKVFILREGDIEEISGVEWGFYKHLDAMVAKKKLELIRNSGEQLASVILELGVESNYSAFSESLVIDVIQKDKTGMVGKAIRMQFSDKRDFKVLVARLEACVESKIMTEVVKTLLADGSMPALCLLVNGDQVVPVSRPAKNDQLGRNPRSPHQYTGIPATSANVD